MVIGIIGYGFVGKAVHNSLPGKHEVIIYDPKFKEFNCFDRILGTEALFIAVPTPTKNGKQDHAILLDTLDRLYANHYEGLIIIKSTTLPKTIKDIYTLFDTLNIMVSPEFLDQATYLDRSGNHLIGVKNIYQSNMYMDIFKDFIMQITNPETACMVKYVHNIFGALKVSFFNEIFDVCETENIDYREMITQLLSVTKHISPCYTKMSVDGERGFGGACFGKDLYAFNSQYDLNTLKAAIETNKLYREDYMLDLER